jgi:hypothetical protein
MAGTNNFLVFNEANNPNNTMSDADYYADLYRLNGLIPMIADPNAHNKMFRQWSIMITALANIIASMNYNASDSDLSTLETNLKSTIEDVAEAKVDTRISNLEDWKDDITATTTEINYLSGADSNIQQQINSISGSLATPFPAWIKNTSYAVGDICICTGFDSYKYLECVVAGTTATTPPANANVGQLVTDNEVKWLVCDWRDSNPVGTIKQDLVKRDGWLKLNGATINVADYPRLVNFLSANSLISAYTATPNDTEFTYGDSNNETLILPNFEGLFIENSASDTLQAVNAGLPNITGDFRQSLLIGNYTADKHKIIVDATNGAFKNGASSIATYPLKPETAYGSGTTDNSIKSIAFDASLSNSTYGKSSTVQPPAVKLIPIIKY